MRRWVIVPVAVAAALAAPSSLAQVVLAPAVFRSHDLPAAATTAFAVTCPRGYVATSAGVSEPASGVTLLDLWPRGLGTYSFRFGNPAGNATRRVTVSVACRKADSADRRARVALRQRPVRFAATIPAGTGKAVEFVCPSHTVPAGIGFVRAESVGIRRATMHAGGFSFVVFNNGTRTRKVVLYGNCLTVLHPAELRTEELAFKITTYRDLVEPGTQRISHACPRGWVALGAGFTLRSPSHSVQGAAALVTGGRWWVENDGQAASVTELQLVCAVLRR
jgi:hypothetical protein